MFLFREATLSERYEVRSSLKQVYGVGWCKSNMIASKLGLAFPFFGYNLNTYNVNLVLFLLKGLVLGDARIRRVVDNNIARLVTIESYKGYRHSLTLPVRGQRTRTNAGTQRSKRYRGSSKV